MKLKSRAARRGNWKIYSQLVGNSVPTICLPFENYFCHYLNVSLDSNINCNPLDNVNEKWIEKFIRWAWLDMFDGKWIEDNFDLYIYFSIVKGKVCWETQSFTNVNSTEKIWPRVKMNYSSASPTASSVLSQASTLFCHTFLSESCAIPSNHLQSVEEDFIVRATAIVPLQIIVE